MNKAARVTHQDIANEVGCDKSTISLALSGSPRLPQATRDRVVAVAHKMGYRPDHGLTMLARSRWMKHGTPKGVTLHYLVQRKKGNVWLQRRYLAHARKRAQERGYGVEEFDLSAYPSGATASKVLFHRGARGIIVPAMPSDVDPEFKGFDWGKFTIVGCALGSLRFDVHGVAPDEFEGARLAWREAARRGYKRIGAALFEHSPIAVDDYTRLGASYAEQSKRFPVRKRIPFLLSDPNDRDAFLAWVDKHRPDAVISLSSKQPYEWLQEAGYRVPEDMGFASLHAHDQQLISGVCSQEEEVARAAVDFLVAQMLDNNWGVPESQQMLMLEPKWREGKTLPLRE